MRKFKKLSCLLGLILLVTNFAAAKEEIIVELRLLKGIREEGKPGPEVIVSSFSEPFIVPIHASIIEPEKKFISHLKSELDSIYQLKNVELLAKGSMIWDGEKQNLKETILLEGHSYLINLSPKVLSKFNVNLRIEIGKFECAEIFLDAGETKHIDEEEIQLTLLSDVKEISISEGTMKEVLDTEIVLNFNEAVVLGFPSNGDPYFLSISVTKKDLSRFVKVEVVEGGVIGGVEGGVVGGVEGGIKGEVEGGVEGGVVSGVLGGVVGGMIYASIQATDPVCGKTVGRGTGFEKENRAVAKYRYKGETYFFCSKECLEKFKKNPEKYIKKILIKPEVTVIKPVKVRIKPVDVEVKIRPGEKTIRPVVDIHLPKPIIQIRPIYSEKCKKEKIEGTVILEVTVDEEGNVVKVQTLRSVHPDLDKAAKEAIKEWKYEQVIKDGKPVPAVFAVTVNFKLRVEDVTITTKRQ